MKYLDTSFYSTARYTASKNSAMGARTFIHSLSGDVILVVVVVIVAVVVIVVALCC